MPVEAAAGNARRREAEAGLSTPMRSVASGVGEDRPPPGLLACVGKAAEMVEPPRLRVMTDGRGAEGRAENGAGGEAGEAEWEERERECRCRQTCCGARRRGMRWGNSPAMSLPVVEGAGGSGLLPVCLAPP